MENINMENINMDNVNHDDDRKKIDVLGFAMYKDKFEALKKEVAARNEKFKKEQRQRLKDIMVEEEVEKDEILIGAIDKKKYELPRIFDYFKENVFEEARRAIDEYFDERKDEDLKLFLYEELDGNLPETYRMLERMVELVSEYVYGIKDEILEKLKK